MRTRALLVRARPFPVPYNTRAFSCTMIILGWNPDRNHRITPETPHDCLVRMCPIRHWSVFLGPTRRLSGPARIDLYASASSTVSGHVVQYLYLSENGLSYRKLLHRLQHMTSAGLGMLSRICWMGKARINLVGLTGCDAVMVSQW